MGGIVFDTQLIILYVDIMPPTFLPKDKTMAKQTSTPAPWNDSMSDGCSGVLDLGFELACTIHDKRYHYGGSIEDKLQTDDLFYTDMCDTPGIWGWIARRGLASIRYHGIRMTTYGYPVGHPMRNGYKIEAWNWLGKSSQIDLRRIDDTATEQGGHANPDPDPPKVKEDEEPAYY
jgi:hypothetical protein